MRRLSISARVIAALALLLAGAAIMLAVLLFIHDIGQKDRLAEQQAEIANVIRQIQAERETNIRNNCESVNRRHRATIRQLDRIIDGLPPEERRAARERSANTILLIATLAPLRDCDEVVRRQVQAETP